MNEQFINIKVDREERPDVDRLYMAFVQATTGGGGWPMSVWLTPDGKAVFWRHLFPARGPLWPGWLSERAPADFRPVERRSRAHRKRGRSRDRRAARGVHSRRGRRHARCRIDDEPRHGANSRDTYDASLGGFGSAPKFPRPSVLNYLFRSGITSRMGRSDRTMALHDAPQNGRRRNPRPPRRRVPPLLGG